MADAFGTALTLAHVLPAAEAASTLGSRTDALEWEIARREAVQYLERAQGELEAAGLREVRTLVTQGVPAERIAASARDAEADLAIVAGSSLDAPGSLGTTVQRLLGLTDASLLVVHGTEHVPPKHLVVLLDGSPRTELVLPSVVSLARAHRAEVSLVHVVSDRTGGALAGPAEHALSQQLTARLVANAENYLQQIRSRALSELPDVRRIVRVRQDERRALLEIASQLHGDLLVLAAHGATCDPTDAFGSVASYCLGHARIPLLVLQDVARAQDRGVNAFGVRHPSGIRLKEEA